MLERDVEAHLVRRVKAAGGLCYKFVSPSNRGVPDRCCIIQGFVAFVEVKRPEGKLTPLQENVIQQMRSHGATVFVVYSKEDVDTFIGGIFDELNGTR